MEWYLRSRHTPPVKDDDTILVNGTEIVGTKIGESAETVLLNIVKTAYRADITNLGFVIPGSNSLSVGGLEFDFVSEGAGILVIFDDGSSIAEIDIRDGLDRAFSPNPVPLFQTTIPQTFTFPSSVTNRTATLAMFFASVGGTPSGGEFRPSAIEVTVDGSTTVFNNLLDSNDGEEWDTLNLNVFIPAGATSLTVQAFSVDNENIGGLPASLVWLTAGLSVPEPSEIGDFVWCDLNDDGIQDAGEPGIEGVMVSLTCDNTLIGDQYTDADGKYLFEDVPPGNCVVEVNVSTAPADKEPGTNCPTTVTVDLQPGQSFLDADFCFILPQSCCESGKPVVLTMQYTGDDCFATSHSQDPGKVSCVGDPAFASLVHIVATNKENPDDKKAKLWFEGDVALDTTFNIDATNAGESELKNTTWVLIYSGPGRSGLLQTVQFHTSCSQDLFEGDQFGASLLVDCDGPRDGGGESCCDAGKPKVLTMQYTGDDCTATSHSQDAGKVSCDGDPNDAPTVFIIASNKSNPDDKKAKVWFSGDVVLDGLFDIDAAVGGEKELKNATFIHIYADNSQSVKLQTVEFHTSCSQPLEPGDQFGASLLVGCEGPPSVVLGECDGNKVKALTMKYTGEDCGASSNTQDSGKVSCVGVPGFASPVHIVATDKENPDDAKAKLWFEDDVGLGDTFNIDATNAGESKLKANTWVLIYSGPGRSGLLQTVQFHTSCSQPLNLGDIFGSLEVVGFTPE